MGSGRRPAHGHSQGWGLGPWITGLFYTLSPITCHFSEGDTKEGCLTILSHRPGPLPFLAPPNVPASPRLGHWATCTI